MTLETETTALSCIIWYDFLLSIIILVTLRRQYSCVVFISLFLIFVVVVGVGV